MFKTGFVQPLAHVTEPWSILRRTGNKLSTLVTDHFRSEIDLKHSYCVTARIHKTLRNSTFLSTKIMITYPFYNPNLYFDVLIKRILIESLKVSCIRGCFLILPLTAKTGIIITLISIWSEQWIHMTKRETTVRRNLTGYQWNQDHRDTGTP
jgi:hypothetical protein